MPPNVLMAVQLLTSLTSAAIKIQATMAQAAAEQRDLTDAELAAVRADTDAAFKAWFKRD